jgi:hypothetical protein
VEMGEPRLTCEEIIEAIIDRLGAGFAGRAPRIVLTRTGPGSLDLDYGTAGHFKLVITDFSD